MAKIRALTPWSKAVPSIGLVSFQEILRDKILYNVFVIAVLLLGMGILASRLTFVRPDRVVLDFGVSAVNLSLSAMAILIGSSLINREIERRTMFLALSRPISQFQFVAGKYMGLSSVIFLNWLLVSASFITILIFSGGLDSGALNSTVFTALYLLLLQAWMIASIAILFSSISTTSLSAILTTGVYLIGTNVTQLRTIASKITQPFTVSCIKAISFMFPNLEYFNLGARVTYGIVVPPSFMIVSTGYAIFVSATAIALAGVLVQRKEA